MGGVTPKTTRIVYLAEDSKYIDTDIDFKSTYSLVVKSNVPKEVIGGRTHVLYGSHSYDSVAHVGQMRIEENGTIKTVSVTASRLVAVDNNGKLRVQSSPTNESSVFLGGYTYDIYFCEM